MTFTAVDQVASYAPPGFTPADGARTSYVYTPARRLDKVIRPDGQEVDLIYDTAPGSGGAAPSGRLQEVRVWDGAAQQPGSSEVLSLVYSYGDP